MTDALTIARFRWPSHAHFREVCGKVVSDTRRALSFDPWDSNDIRAAELAVIERGLAEEYGNALCRLTVQSERYPEGSVGEWAATIRTAPLDVCVRALAAVIRAQEVNP